METMNDFFKDEELKYGKILVLNSSHKLKLVEIKKSIHALKLKEIKRKKIESKSILPSSLEELIYRICILGLEVVEKGYGDDIKIYKVEGDNASTSFLRLTSKDIRSSVNWSSKDIKNLHNALYTKRLIEEIKNKISEVKESHNDAISLFERVSKKNYIKQKTNVIEKLNREYGEKDMQLRIDKINELIKNTW
jgi:hypothetical protein